MQGIIFAGGDYLCYGLSSVVFVQFMEILTSLIFKVCWFRRILSCVVCVVSGYFRLDAWEKCVIVLYLMMCHKH